MDFLFLTWDELQNQCFKLVKRIKNQNLKLDRIVCISRGGLIVARILSDFLDLPISNFTIVSYVSVGITGKPKIAEKLVVDLKNESILLVDEIVDHGTTLKCALDYLKTKKPKKIYSLAPIIKPWTKVKPDYYLVKTKKWVVYPYELKETIDDLKKIFTKENKSTRELVKTINQLGFNSQQTKYFLNCRE
jgi:uncharacterized protein